MSNPAAIMIVEDEPLIAMMIEEMANDLGWAVGACLHTEADAFAFLNAHNPCIAVLDINLGLTTSLAVAAACRDRDIPVVFTTGYTASDIPPQCGNAPVLAKPFSTDELALALRRGLQQHARA